MRHPEEMAEAKTQSPGKAMSEHASDALQGINRAQLTLQELQDLAERQRQQILYNSKELMEKQQQLMRMHHDFRNKLKIQSSQAPVPVSPKEKTSREQDAYAKMLRETYQNHMGKLHGMNQAQHEVDAQKFSNVELAHELDRVRAIFSSKQSELADAVKKVDVLTKQLDERKNGMSTWNKVPTPERITRRRKIQAAKDVLDKLRNELIVRNETNTQQNHQLQLQRDIIQEKKQELRELNTRMKEIGSALRQQYGGNFDPNRTPPNYVATNGGADTGVFANNFLHDTLTRKRNGTPHDGYGSDSGGGNRSPLLSARTLHYTRRGDLYVTPDGREFDHPPTERELKLYRNNNDLSYSNGLGTAYGRSPNSSPHQPQSRTDVVPDEELQGRKSVFKDTPLSGNQVWKNQNNLMIRTDMLGKGSPSHSPSSSVSSMSSLSSNTPDDAAKPSFLFGKEAPPPPPPRTTPIGVLIDRTQAPAEPPSAEFLANLRKQKGAKLRSEKSSVSSANSSRKDRPIYSDFTLSGYADQLRSKYRGYRDALNSVSGENLTNKQPAVKAKPALAPKPTASVTPVVSESVGIDVPDRAVLPNSDEKLTRRLSLLDDDPSVTDDQNEHPHLIRRLSKEPIPKDMEVIEHEHEMNHTAQHTNNASVVKHNENDSPNESSWPSPPNPSEGPSEPQEFELSFADIDEINLTQNDWVPWNMNDSASVSSQEDDSSEASFDINVIPVVISVPPEKMPPPILKRPDKPRGHNRRVVLDPFALLLDSALEGEIDMVRQTLARVPDPSRPNAEGITALHNAVCGNHKDVVKFLVEVGCDINAADNNGWTPLHCAAFYNDTELCRYLVEHGASVFATTYTDYQTPAHKCSRLDDNYDQCFGYLHECKENVGRTSNGLVYALYDYIAEDDDELNFHTGEALTIIRRGDAIEKEWWWAKNRRGDMGYVPCNLIGNFPRIAAEV